MANIYSNLQHHNKGLFLRFSFEQLLNGMNTNNRALPHKWTFFSIKIKTLKNLNSISLSDS